MRIRFRWEQHRGRDFSDHSYQAGYFDEITIEERLKRTAALDFVTTEHEPLFDAADILRIGKDLFCQHGLTTNRRGMQWLQRHFPDHRVHAVNFPGDPYPIHIDATFVPLRPGLIMNNPNRKLPDAQREIFAANDWEIVDAAQPSNDRPPPLCYSSVWLSMNVLILDHKTVIVEESEHRQAEQLDSLGFEVLPLAFRDAYPFGGGLHCATADVLREGSCDDYFPRSSLAQHGSGNRSRKLPNLNFWLTGCLANGATVLENRISAKCFISAQFCMPSPASVTHCWEKSLDIQGDWRQEKRSPVIVSPAANKTSSGVFGGLIDRPTRRAIPGSI